MNTETVSLLRQYGGIARIPEDVLQQHNLCRLYNESTGLHTISDEGDFQAVRRECFGIMKKYRGYIFAGDLDRIFRFINRRESLDQQDVRRIRSRAIRFIEAGIPPIFNVDFYLPSKLEYSTISTTAEKIEIPRVENIFPSVDFVIQFATGAYERKIAAMAIEHRAKTGRERQGFAVQPATVRDVLDFRRLAFTADGKISIILMRETLAYVQEFFEFKDGDSRQKAVDVNYLIFNFLEEMLRDLKHEKMSYDSWNDDHEVFYARRWYLCFAPEERTSVARAFFDAWVGKKTKSDKDRRVLKRMKAVFPELAASFEGRNVAAELQRLQDFLDTAIARSDFHDVPEFMFNEEPWAATCVPAAREAFRTACVKLGSEQPEKLLSNSKLLHHQIPFPPRLPFVPSFQRILNEERYKVACGLSDEAFLAIFAGEATKSRLVALGHLHSGGLAEGAGPLHRYILKRYRQLKKKK